MAASLGLVRHLSPDTCIELGQVPIASNVNLPTHLTLDSQLQVASSVQQRSSQYINADQSGHAQSRNVIGHSTYPLAIAPEKLAKALQLYDTYKTAASEEDPCLNVEAGVFLAPWTIMILQFWKNRQAHRGKIGGGATTSAVDRIDTDEPSHRPHNVERAENVSARASVQQQNSSITRCDSDEGTARTFIPNTPTPKDIDECTPCRTLYILWFVIVAGSIAIGL
ncbi:hypothetical protein V8E51_006023 [Hyaloscypha variabilis]